MQYILTDAEYNDLVAQKRAVYFESTAALQELCTLAAKHIPVTPGWRSAEKPEPWGCILDSETNPGYCDECPAQKICPLGRKEWSK